MNKKGIPKEIDEIEISMFKDAFSKNSENVNLVNLLEAIEAGRWKDEVESLREYLKTGEREKYDDKKRNLPAITVSGIFEARSKLQTYSGLIQVDLDKLQNPAWTRDILKDDVHTFVSFLSPSGQGVKAFVLVPDDPETHLESFLATERYFKERYALEIDESCKDINRLCFVSFDPNIWINPSATTLNIDEWSSNKEEGKNSNPGWTPHGNNTKNKEQKIKWGSTDWPKVFESAGLKLKSQGQRIMVLCPFRDNHTTGFRGTYLFPGKEGSWGWYCYHAHCSHIRLRDVAEKLWEHVIKFSDPYEPNDFHNGPDLNSNPWSDPLPLPKQKNLPPKLDPEILPEPLCEYCRASAFENETTPEAVAGFLLSALGILTGSRIAINPDPRKANWYEYGVRSCILVMPVSSNKTAAFRSGLNPLDRIQKFKDLEFREKNKIFESDKFFHDNKIKSLLKKFEKNNSKDIEDQIKNLESIEPIPPPHEILIANRATPEKILELISKGSERGILLKSDEVLGLLNNTEKKGNEGVREFFVEAMTVARNFSGHTISRGTDYTDALALSIVGCIQPKKLLRLLNEMEKGLKDDGLLQRFIWIWPQQPSFESFESLSEKDIGVSRDLLKRVQIIFEKLERIKPEDIGAKKTDYDPVAWVGFDPEAQNIWRIWRKELRSNLIGEEGLSDGYVAWLGKSERLVAGLSLTFHSIECLSENILPGPIARDELERAIGVWDVVRHHAKRIFSLTQTGTLEVAHLLVSRLNKLEPSFSLRDLKQKNWRHTSDNEVLLDAIDWLVELNYLKEIQTDSRGKPGRPSSKKFLVNPKAVI